MNTENIALKPLDKSQLAKKEDVRKSHLRGHFSVQVAYEKIEEREGFQDRINYGNLEELADNISALGLIDPLRGDILSDGTFIITDGHRRWKAIGILIDRGDDRFQKVSVIVNPVDFTDVQRLLFSQSSNNQKKNFEPIEEAGLFKKLLGMPHPETSKPIKSADIAKLYGVSKMYVSNSLRLAGITDDEKQAVLDGVISPTAMTDLMKAGVPEEQRSELLESARESGEKVKVTDVASVIEEAKENLGDYFGITSIEFTNIEGTIDTSVITTNLNAVRFTKRTDSNFISEKVFLALYGPVEVEAGDITKFSDGFEVTNPDLLICDLNASGTLEMEITIGKMNDRADEQNIKKSKSLSDLLGNDSNHLGKLLEKNLVDKGADDTFDDDETRADREKFNAKVEPDEVFDDTANSEADHQEKQDTGLFSGAKAKSPTLVTKLVECSLMTRSIEHWIEQAHWDEESKSQIRSAMSKLSKSLGDCKKIAEALR